MAQRNSVKVTTKSDLQPVYDLINALQPRNVKAAYNRLGHRTRALLLIAGSTVILLWALTTILSLAVQHVRATTGPFLMDALKAPYSLEARLIPLPPADQSFVLPNTVGEYAVMGSLFQATPIPPQAAESTEPVPALPAMTSVISSQVASCLSTALEGPTPTNCATYNASFVAAGDYQKAAGTSLNIVMAYFASHSDASEVMRSLQRQASTNGTVGNYAIGVGQVDYFYSSQSQLYVFTWANGAWVYTASSPSFDDLEAFIKQFPY